jgi:hypothetical protein
MKRVLVVVMLLADGVKPCEEIGIGRRWGRLELRFAHRRAKVSRYLGAKLMLLKIGALPWRALLFHVDTPRHKARSSSIQYAVSGRLYAPPLE